MFKVCRGYASAWYYDIAPDQRRVVYLQCQSLLPFIRERSLCGTIISDRTVNDKLKLNAVKCVISHVHCDDSFLQIFELLLRHRRGGCFGNVVECFMQVYRKDNKIGDVSIVSCVPIGEENVSKVKSYVCDLFGFSSAIINDKVDTSILGGFVLSVDGLLFDCSLRKRLYSILH